jgi:hypothetical protein
MGRRADSLPHPQRADSSGALPATRFFFPPSREQHGRASNDWLSDLQPAVIVMLRKNLTWQAHAALSCPPSPPRAQLGSPLTRATCASLSSRAIIRDASSMVIQLPASTAGPRLINVVRLRLSGAGSKINQARVTARLPSFKRLPRATKLSLRGTERKATTITLGRVK